MMKKIIIFLLLLIFPSYVSASAYIVMDADSGRVLASLNMNERYLIASTTKIMTAIIAIENGRLSDVYTVKDEIKEVHGSMIYLNVNEKISLEDLLYGLMLQSGNDAAMVIAKNIKGYKKFINLMNKKALELGMYNTTFENPHGLDEDSKNYSTAYDLALLMKYAIKNKTFRKITQTKKYITSRNNVTYEWYNKNKLLGMYKYTTGGKIGYTTKSGHAFVSSATKGRENLIVVTLKEPNRFERHKALYKKYFENYDKYQILNRYTFSINSIFYDKYHLYIKNDFEMMLSDSEKKNLKLNVVLINNKRVKENKPVGYVEIFLKNKSIHKENIYAVSKKSKINKIKSWLFFWK